MSTQKSHVYLIFVFLLFLCALKVLFIQTNLQSHFVFQTFPPRGVDLSCIFDPDRRCPAQPVVPPNVTPFDILRLYEESSGSVQEKVGCHIYRLTFTSPGTGSLKELYVHGPAAL